MTKDFVWTEEEFLRGQQTGRKIPGVVSPGFRVFQVILAGVGLYALFKAFLYGNELLQRDAKGSLLLWLIYNGAMLLLCLLHLFLALLCIYRVFFAENHKLRRYLKKNPTQVLAPRTVQLEKNIFRLSTAEGSTEFILSPSHTVCFSEEFIYGTADQEDGKKRLLWMIPRRIFSEEEEKSVRESLQEYCSVETVRISPAVIQKADHIILTVGVGLQILLFSLNLVSLQDLPGRWSFNYWIWSVILAIPCLLAYLYTAVRLYQSGKKTAYKRFATVNLAVTAAAALLFLPVGGSSELAYGWSAFLVILFGLQIRALWLTAAGSGTVPRTFKRSLTIIALVNLCIALLCLAIFLFSLPGAGLTLRTFCENIPDPMSTDPNAKGGSEAVYACAAHWVHGMIAACCTGMSLLIESAVSAFRDRKALPRLLMMIAAATMLFFCRWCRSPLEFILWTVTICGLFVLCLREIRNKKSG
ncbi:MAG: hypothetical protein J5496_05045 [Lachnospiraceae bacterium]|nr:hypothetical protein [Lachnospiraceae bacterium]